MNNVSKSNFNWLRSEMPSLIEEGGLDSATADGVLERLRNRLSDDSATRSIFASIVSVLGALFLMAGIILLLGHNWDTLSKGVRLFFSVAPLVIVHLLGGYVLLKAKGVAWRETVAAVMPIALLAAIALVAQIYQITGDGKTTYLITATLTLPMIYLFRSVGSFLVYMVLMTTFGFACCDLWGGDGNGSQLLPYWLLWIGVLPFVYVRLQRGGVATFSGYWVRIAVMLAMFCGLLMCFMESLFDGDSTLVIFSLVFCLLYSFGRLVGEGQCKERARIWSMSGKVVTAIFLAASVFVVKHLDLGLEELAEIAPFCGVCILLWLGGVACATRENDVDWIVNSSAFLFCKTS